MFYLTTFLNKKDGIDMFREFFLYGNIIAPCKTHELNEFWAVVCAPMMFDSLVDHYTGIPWVVLPINL